MCDSRCRTESSHVLEEIDRLVPGSSDMTGSGTGSGAGSYPDAVSRTLLTHVACSMSLCVLVCRRSSRNSDSSSCTRTMPCRVGMPTVHGGGGLSSPPSSRGPSLAPFSQAYAYGAADGVRPRLVDLAADSSEYDSVQPVFLHPAAHCKLPAPGAGGGGASGLVPAPGVGVHSASPSPLPHMQQLAPPQLSPTPSATRQQLQEAVAAAALFPQSRRTLRDGAPAYDTK
jgi:hypothetical protein